MADPAAWNDKRVEQTVARLLRTGVIAAALLVCVGGAVRLASHGRTVADYHWFAGEPAALRGLPGIVAEASALHGRGLIQLGLLVLIATPIARVAFSAAAFALRRDWLYVTITLLVLAALLFSLGVRAG